VATLGEVPRGRPNLEAEEIHRESPLERNLTTSRGILIVIITPIIKGNERSERILKILRKPNHPLSTKRLRKGKKKNLGFYFKEVLQSP
jgi:hypothetical protein